MSRKMKGLVALVLVVLISIGYQHHQRIIRERWEAEEQLKSRLSEQLYYQIEEVYFGLQQALDGEKSLDNLDRLVWLVRETYSTLYSIAELNQLEDSLEHGSYLSANSMVNLFRLMENDLYLAARHRRLELTGVKDELNARRLRQTLQLLQPLREMFEQHPERGNYTFSPNQDQLDHWVLLVQDYYWDKGVTP